MILTVFVSALIGYILAAKTTDLAKYPTINTTATTGFEGSYGYPNPYPNNGKQRWILQVPDSTMIMSLNFMKFDIEGYKGVSCTTYDYLLVLDISALPNMRGVCDMANTKLTPSYGIFCNNYNPIATGKYIYLPTTGIVVEFCSDNFNTKKKGFQMIFLQQPATSPPTGPTTLPTTTLPPTPPSFSCGRTINLTPGTAVNITSPQYPGPYPPNSMCTWNVTSLNGRINFRTVLFDVEGYGSGSVCSFFDWVKITYNRITSTYCNPSHGPYLTIHASYALVNFHSDLVVNRMGFVLIASSPIIPTTAPTMNPMCGSTFSLTSVGQVQDIYSPNWPNKYPANANCSWTLTQTMFSSGYSFRFYFPFFKTESGYDGLIVYPQGLAVSGFDGLQTNNSFVYKTSQIRVTFTSDYLIQYEGFHLQVSLVPTPFSCASGQFKCRSANVCITAGQRCDGNKDCADNSDETGAWCQMSTQCGKSVIPPNVALPNNRIVNGTIAKPGSWPWQVSVHMIENDGSLFQICGGSLISPHWIISAAHCFYGKTGNPGQFVFKIGSWNRFSMDAPYEVDIKAKFVKIHPNYNPTTHSHDIAIVRLAQDVVYPFNNHTNGVCLPQKGYIVPTGTNCVITGWGDTHQTGQKTVLNQAILPIIPNNICGDVNHYGPGKVDSTMICAGYERGGKDTCQLSYAETHPMFETEDSTSDTHSNTFSTFYRMVPASWNLHHARFAFLSQFEWTRVGTLKQSDDPRYALPHEAFTTQLVTQLNIDVVTTAEISSEKLNMTQALETLKSHDARIIVADFNRSFTRLIFCEAYKLDMYGPNYVWLVPGYGPHVFKDKYALPVTCTDAQILTAMHSHFAVEPEITRIDNTKLISGKDVDEYINEYLRLCDADMQCDRHNQYHGYAYDGIWALSLALDKVITEYTNGSTRFDPMILRDDLHRKTFTEHLLSALEVTDFEGVTGTVDFLDNSRLGKVQISMFLTDEGNANGSYVRMGSYDGANDTFVLDFVTLNVSGWSPPLDRTQQVYVPQRVHRLLYIVFCVLSLLGMVLAIVFLSINFHYRNHKFIRMSSPNMNNLIICGCLLTYLSVILLGLDTSFVSDHGFTVLCNAKVWVLCLGFTLAFGSMFSKTWRVHSIFTNIKLNKKAIRDYKLFLIVGVLVLIDIILLSAWLIAAPMKKRIIHLVPQLDAVNNRKLVPEIEQCHSDKAVIFQGLMYGNKGLLMVMGCFLAWETRRVNVPALNDSKYIGMSVYNVVLMCIIGLSLSFILSTQVNESYLVTSTFIMFCTTLTLCLVFVPKIVELVRNPKGGERKYRHGMMKAVLNRNKLDPRRGSIVSMDDMKDNLIRAEQDNQVWRHMLDEKCKEIAEVVTKLREYGDFEDPMLKDSVIESSSTVPEDPFGGVWLGGHTTSMTPSPCSPSSPRPVHDANETTSLLTPKNPAQTRRSSGFGFSLLRSSKKKVSSDHSSGPPDDPNGNSTVFVPQARKPSASKLPKGSKSIDKNLLLMISPESQKKGGIYCSLPDLSTSPELSQCIEMGRMSNKGKSMDNEDSESDEEGERFAAGLRFIDSILSDEISASGASNTKSSGDQGAVDLLVTTFHEWPGDNIEHEFL